MFLLLLKAIPEIAVRSQSRFVVESGSCRRGSKSGDYPLQLRLRPDLSDHYRVDRLARSSGAPRDTESDLPQTGSAPMLCSESSRGGRPCGGQLQTMSATYLSALCE
jgi:hypothetical protein